MKVKSIEYNLVAANGCAPDDKPIVELFNKVSRPGQASVSPFQYQVSVARKIKEIVTDPERGNGLIILRNPTGSGKSLAGYSGSLLFGFRSVFMYPTKELVREQYSKFMEYKIDGSPFDAVPFSSNPARKINDEEMVLLLEEKRRDLPSAAREKYKKADAIVDLYSEARAIFTTIDSFYYAISYALSRDSRYAGWYHKFRSVTADGVKAAVATRIPDVYFFDEFDSYDVKQRCEIEWMIVLLCHPAFQKRGNACVILASATPDDDMVARLRSAGITIHDEFLEPEVERSPASRQILPEVEIIASTAQSFRGSVHLAAFFDDASEKAIRDCVTSGRKVVFIGDSVKDCMDVAGILKTRCGLTDEQVGEIHGLGAVTDADRMRERQKPVVIGNRTIDLGIDFDADVLVMSAPTPALFEQRLGRLRGARARDCTCYVMLPARVAAALSARFGTAEVSRRELHDFLHHGSGGHPIYDWFLRYDEFRRGDAPIEFLNVLDDLSGGLLDDAYAPQMIDDKWKMEMRQAAKSVFQALYKRDVSHVAARRTAMRMQARDEGTRDFLDWIFMQFRPASLMDVIVHDVRTGACKVYGVETILRHGIIRPEGCKIIEKARARAGDPWYQTIKEQGRYLPDRVAVIAITGYTPPGEKGKNAYFTAPFRPFYENVIKPNGNLSFTYRVSGRSAVQDEISLKGIEYPVVIDGWHGLRLVSDDPVVQSVINSCVNPLIKGDKHAVFFGLQLHSDRVTAASFAFAMEAKLRLPLYDKTAPFIIDLPVKNLHGASLKRFIGIIGVDLSAFLLEGTLKERNWYVNSTTTSEDD